MSAAARFCPPAPFPVGAKDPPLALMALRMLRSQIEGFPRALFEDDAWNPGLPGTPLFVMAPDAVRQVLHDDAGNFSHGALFRRMMRPAWGSGLLITEGAAWRAQRRAAAPAFRPAEMASLAPIFSRVAQSFLDHWRRAPEIDAMREMQRLTFDVILETMLSGAADFDRDAMAARVATLLEALGKIRPSYLLAPDAWHERRPSVRTPVRSTLVADITRMIVRRRSAPATRDLVDLLLALRDADTGAPMSDTLLADNLLGFIVAGHETTAITLTWALYLAASHRPTMDRLRAEAIAVAGEAPIDATHVDRLRFARQVISETMRLYPQAFLLTRVAQQEATVAGRRVRRGQRVNVPVYAIHRRAMVFDDPHAFDPDRFAAGRPEPDRFAYLPFGAGPRICLGAAFAMTEATVVLATLARSATFEPPPPEGVWPVARLSLSPRDGMPMRVTVH